MTDSSIQVPVDSTGKKVATIQIIRTSDSAVVEIQVVQASGLVSEAPQSLNDGDTQPLSLTAQGRLRVSSIQADIERVWQSTTADPWGSLNNQWDLGELYV